MSEDRTKFIGGSDAPVIIGVSPFKTVDVLAQEKAGLIPEAPIDPVCEERGKTLEPVIINLYRGVTQDVVTTNVPPIKHPDHPFLIGHLDGRVHRKEPEGMGVFEAKAPGSWVFRKIRREGPEEYMLVQCQFYMALANLPYAVLSVFGVEAWELLHYTIPADKAVQDYIITECVEFWRMVQQGEVPMPKRPSIPIPKPDVKYLRVEQGGNAAMEALFREYAELQAELREGKKAEEILKANLIDSIGENEVVDCAGCRVHYTEQAGRVSIDAKALKAQMPEVYEKFSKHGKPFKTLKFYDFNRKKEDEE